MKPSPYCEACQSWHPIPRDVRHHVELKCFAPFVDYNGAPAPRPQKADPAPIGSDKLALAALRVTRAKVRGRPPLPSPHK